jgi:hypothetical protein
MGSPSGLPFFYSFNNTIVMPFTNNAQATLQAVNEILSCIGQAPVTTIEAQTIEYEDGTTVEAVINPEVAIAYETLLQVSREVQAEGWTFNREVEYPMTPDTNGYLSITNGMLQLDLSDTVANTNYDTVIRNGRLYDKIAHTDVWDTTKTYSVDVLWYQEFPDLPQVFRDYITARTATRCAIRLVGDVNLTQSLAAFETWRRANCMEYECNEGDYTMFGFKKGTDFYSSYQPFKALSR